MGTGNSEFVEGVATVIEKPNGEVQVLLQDDKEFPITEAVAAVASELDFVSPWFYPSNYLNSSNSRRLSPYQVFVQNGKLGLRDLLAPSDKDFDEIINRVNWYSNANVYISRGLSLRAALNASEFQIFAPHDQKQQEWCNQLYRDLRMYSVMREIFWNLRAFDQTVVLWKTGRASTGEQTRSYKPLSMECQDLRIVQPKGPGHVPELFMFAHKDPLINALSSMDGRKTAAKRAREVYPELMIQSAKRQEPIPVKLLEPYGYHYEYIARNRRDWDDAAFPTMYSIFADLELLALAAEIDANALHHYKAGILQFAIGPENPTAIDVIPSEKTLRTTEEEVKRQLQVRLSTLFTRGDVKVNWIVPPKEFLSEDKVIGAMRRVFNWLGFPKVAWAGENLEGAYAAAVTAFKFLRAETEDDRSLVKEFMEGWLTERAKANNGFKGANEVKVRFDQNALVDDRIILEQMRLFMTSGGASLPTILEMADLDIEYEAAMRQKTKEIEKDYDVNFKALSTPNAFGATNTGKDEQGNGGRPNTGERPRAEEDTGAQPRPMMVSKGMLDSVASKLGLSSDYLEDMMREVSG